MRPATVFSLLASCLFSSSPQTTEAQIVAELERRGEQSAVDSMQRELLPRICSLAGFQRCEPVPVQAWTRAELRRWMVESMSRAFPRNEWRRLGRCLTEIGLNPAGLDLQDALLDLLVSQAGAGYSPELGSYITLLDVPSRMKSPSMRTMVASHELTHALQDQAIGMEALFLSDLHSLDRSFAHRALLEGMASVVMYSLREGSPLSDLPDVGAYMRDTFTRSPEALSAPGFEPPPSILVQYLFEPYVVGSAFVQHILRAEPERSLASFLNRMPGSQEQVLHPEKYLSGDLPTPIDLSAVEDLLPDDWQAFHENEIGEQDLRLLLTLSGSTAAASNGGASGWDGFSFAGYVDGSDNLAVVGVSVWDSPEDARVFLGLFEGVLTKLHGAGGYGIKLDGDRVSFAVGFDRGTTDRILSRY